jgi:proteasome alpha subunit
MEMPGRGYDSAITIFSPDGRLFQVEYAIEAIRRGTTAIGIKIAGVGVVLTVEKRILSKLVAADSIEKIFKIDEHISAAIAGLTADARILIDQARTASQMHRLTYDEPINVEMLARDIGDLKQLYTQYAGVRPFGVKLLIAGVDELGSHLFMTDPSGTYLEYFAAVIGAGEQKATEVLEQGYKSDLDLEGAVLLSLNALKQAIESELDESNVEIALITEEEKKFKKLSAEEITRYIAKEVQMNP